MAESPSSPARLMAQEATLDFVSLTNGRDYRLMVWRPPGPAPARGFPVLWVLDGAGYAGLAVDMVRNRGVLGGEIEPAVVVSVGYPTDDIGEWMTRRWHDFTASAPEPEFVAPGASYGGADGFFSALIDEAVPRVGDLAAIDTSRMALFGHSMGGLAVLYGLFTRPAMFRSWLAVSPSLWWSEGRVLKNEAAFVARVAVGEVEPRVFIAVGGREEEVLTALPAGTRGSDLAEVNRRIASLRMVGNAADLAARLRAIGGGPGYDVRYVCHAGETHMSVPFMAMRAALDLALPVTT